MHTPGFTWYTAPLPSRASSLLQVHLPTCPPGQCTIISVGAGLPAMHTPGFTWYTAPLPSRASSLLQVHLPTCPPARPVHHHFCGSWLASDAYTGIFLVHRTAAIASKLAPADPPAHPPDQRTITTVGSGLPAYFGQGAKQALWLEGKHLAGATLEVTGSQHGIENGLFYRVCGSHEQR